MFRSMINRSGTRATIFLNDALFGDVKPQRGSWHFSDAQGRTQNFGPVDAIPLGAVLRDLRSEAISRMNKAN